jgi:dihydrodipicolinate synthase/N-acetylneuraminate lyase
MYDLFISGDVKEAMCLQFRVLRLFDRLFAGHNFPDGFRVGMGARGFDFGAGRQPSGVSIPDQDVEAMKADIAALSRVE